MTSDDAVSGLLAQLRCHTRVFDRYRAVTPHGTVKGISLTDALRVVAEEGGRVDHAELWRLPGGGEYLGPWRQYWAEP